MEADELSPFVLSSTGEPWEIPREGHVRLAFNFQPAGPRRRLEKLKDKCFQGLLKIMLDPDASSNQKCQ